jgi:hypothetical protein
MPHLVSRSPLNSRVHGEVTTPQRAVVTLTGRIDRAVAVEVSVTIKGLLARGAHLMSVDVSGAYDIDPHLLTVLALTRTDLARLAETEPPAALSVTGVVVPEILVALRDAGPDEAFVVYESVRQGR